MDEVSSISCYEIIPSDVLMHGRGSAELSELLRPSKHLNILICTFGMLTTRHGQVTMPQDDPIAALIDGYHELNPTAIDELEECPSSLEFMRYVAKNRPFVVRRGAHDWNALKLWNAKYLKESMKGRDVNVAVTPKG